MLKKASLKIATILCFFCLLVVACKPGNPAPATQPAAPLTCVVGGLGGDQTAAMQLGLRSAFPAAQVVGFGPSEAWKADVASYCQKSAYSQLVLIGHSFGAATVAEAAARLPRVELLVLLDPVDPTPGEADISVTANVVRCLVFRRSKPGIERMATVHGIFEEHIVPDAGHNDVPGSPWVFGFVKAAMQGALK